MVAGLAAALAVVGLAVVVTACLRGVQSAAAARVCLSVYMITPLKRIQSALCRDTQLAHCLIHAVHVNHSNSRKQHSSSRMQLFLALHMLASMSDRLCPCCLLFCCPCSCPRV